jgi:NADPH2:quinone reductase
VIDAVGEGVDAARAGHRVWTWMAAAGRRWGTAAEWSVVPGEGAVPLGHHGVSAELGASPGVLTVTAHRCLFADGPVDGKTVLAAHGAGAVGHFAIELAKHVSARVVDGSAARRRPSSPYQAGADLVVNYREPSAAAEISSFGPVDRVIEVALGANLQLDLAVLRPGGVIVTYAAEPGDPVLPVRACMNANVILRFVLLYGVPAAALDRAARDITAALRAGALSELPVHRFGLDDIVAAQDAVQHGTIGKVLVTPR